MFVGKLLTDMSSKLPHSYLRLLLVLSALLLILSAAQPAAAFKFLTMEVPKEFSSSGARIHPVDLIGNEGKELLVVQGSTATLLTPDGSKFKEHQKLLIPVPTKANGKTYYAFARLGDGTRHSLVLLMPEGIFYFPTEKDLISDTPVPLIKKEMIQGQGSGQQVQHFEFAIDLNGDKLDDFLVPEQNSFTIYRQTEPKQFSPVSLPRNPYEVESSFAFHRELPDDPVRTASISGNISTRRGVTDLLLYDANSDGLQDLVYSSTRPGPNSRQVERYEVFLQRKGFSFDQKPAQVLEVPFETGADVTFRDVNRDGRLDTIMVKSNFDIVNPRTIIKFYVAGKDSYQLFTRETDRFVTKDPIGLVRVADFNNDGATDFATTFFSYQFGSAEDVVDFALGNKLRFKLQFYLGRAAAGFNRSPDFEKELSIAMKPDSYKGYLPVMITEDLNGDKTMDLVVRREEGLLEVYPSKDGLAFERNPAGEIETPDDAVITFEDMDADGLQDIIISSPLKESCSIHISRP